MYNENGVLQNENGLPENENGTPENENGVPQNENGTPQNENEGCFYCRLSTAKKNCIKGGVVCQIVSNLTLKHS